MLSPQELTLCPLRYSKVLLALFQNYCNRPHHRSDHFSQYIKEPQQQIVKRQKVGLNSVARTHNSDQQTRKARCARLSNTAGIDVQCALLWRHEKDEL